MYRHIYLRRRAVAPGQGGREPPAVEAPAPRGRERLEALRVRAGALPARVERLSVRGGARPNVPEWRRFSVRCGVASSHEARPTQRQGM